MEFAWKNIKIRWNNVFKGGDDMKIHTELAHRYGKARIINRYNAETGEFLDYTVLDADRHLVIRTTNYDIANKMLMEGNIKR